MGWFSNKSKSSSSGKNREPKRGSEESKKRDKEIAHKYIKEHVRKGGDEHDFDGYWSNQSLNKKKTRREDAKYLVFPFKMFKYCKL